MNFKYLLLAISLPCTISIQAQSVDALLQLAVENNPELRSLQLQFEAALHKAPQVSQLPDPLVGIGIPVSPPETRLGAQRVMVGASQMFPWFGTLHAKEDIALTMAKVKYERVSATRLELFYSIKSAYYQLNLLAEKQTIIRRNIQIFNALENVALAKVESGRATAADVIRVQIKRQELAKELERLENQKLVYYAQINKVTNADSETKITAIDSIENIAILSFDLENYRNKIRANHPLISQLNWQIETSKKEQSLTELSRKPTLGFGLDYSLVGQRTDASPEHNGRDILIPRAMISFPISQKKYDAKYQEEALLQESIDYQKIELENKMISLIQQYKAAYDDALLLIELSEAQIISTQSVYNILLGEYSSKGTRFDELMQIQNQLIMYDLDIVKARVQTHLAKANIDRLTDF